MSFPGIDRPPCLTRRARSLRIGAMLLAAALATAPTPLSAAEEAVPGEAGIEDQVNQGIALRLAGNDEAALGVFLDLEKKAPDSVRVLLHIATAALATGRWIMAHEYLQKADAHRDAPYYQRHKAAIENVERIIAQRVGLFRVRGAPAGAEVRLSGELVGTLPMSNAKAVEVGSYLLEVTKAGYFPMRRPITVGGGNLTQEVVDLREQKAFVGVASLQPTAVDENLFADAESPSTSVWRGRWLGWTLTGFAAAAGATTIVAFGIREQDAAHWNDDGQCLDPAAPGVTREARCAGVHHDLEVAQTVGITAAIATAVLGTSALVDWLWIGRDRPSSRSPRDHARLTCDPGVASFQCAGSF